MRSSTTALAVLGLAAIAQPALAASSATIDSLRSTWGLTASNFTFDMPSKALASDDAVSHIYNNWELAEFYWGESDIVFTADPSTTSSTLVRRRQSTTSDSSTSQASKTSSASASKTSSATTSSSTDYLTTDLNGEAPVLRIGYPQGSYNKKSGGAQFYASPLNSTSSSSGEYQRMLLSYDIWFPTGYAFNLGGKLPGLRGGSSVFGCSGGSESDGTSCFSTRLMWRSGGAGEVYAYVPTTQKNFCKSSGVTCNSDYGTSLGRDNFVFATGQWQTIYLLVVLNADGKANGVVKLWYNGVEAINFTNLVIRKSTSISSIGGLFFSTFFGGSDSSWATPTQQYTYYRNMQLYAGYGAANGSGDAISSGAMPRTTPGGWGIVGLAASAVVMAVVGLVGL